MRKELTIEERREIYRLMEEFRLNPSNGNRFFESVVVFIEEKLNEPEVKN